MASSLVAREAALQAAKPQPAIPPPACESTCVLKSRAFVSAGLAPKIVHRNLSPAELYEMALAHEKDTLLTETGALAARSGEKTGRSPKDKRVVREPTTEKYVWWAGGSSGAGGSPNFEMDERAFLVSRESAVAYLNSLPRGVFVVDGYANWDNAGGHRVKVRVVAERPYHALFMRNMLIRPPETELSDGKFGEPDLVIFNAGHLSANRYGTGGGSRTCVALNLKAGEMVILGTEYAGEMKKGVFTYMHWAMPKQGVLSLHSGCNVGRRDGEDEEENTTLFFGLSGTGKTTLSTDPRRPLVGDDEHCWADDGVTNIEGGCYAKTIGLKRETEPEIFAAVRFGAVLENVAVDAHTRAVDYSSSLITENTRACYPIEHIANARIPCRAGHPKNVVLLCCDARGVLPPVSRLSLEQAMYHFISGYTSKVAGTEVGVTEPEATFSACYGGAFLVWHPMKYAAMLAEKMQKHGARAWLVNTGWCGGGAADGSGAKRVPLKHTRAIVDAIHSGALDGDEEEFERSPIFGLQVPRVVPGVPKETLDQRAAWRLRAAESKGDEGEEAAGRRYVSALEGLAELFVANFNTYLSDAEAHVGATLAERILSGGPDRAWATAHGARGLHEDQDDF